MDALELLIDFHLEAERQGPGSPEDTLRALSFMGIRRDQPLAIADIGCGSGAQTLTLARHLTGSITAVDLFPGFLSKLESRANALGLAERITTLEASMDDLPFEDEAFDLLWSEGAIYNMGFAAGIGYWKRFLKPGGFLAVSEITWTGSSRPKEIEAHWKGEYPEIDTPSNKIRILEDNGFSPAGFFFLPEASWLDTYYSPMEKRFEAFLARHGHSAAARDLVEAEKEEIRLYRQHKDFYSYGFYIAKKMPGTFGA